MEIGWKARKDIYYFDDTDWQIQQAEQNNVNIIYVLGMKTGRWPECHIPDLGAWSFRKRPAVRIVKIYYSGCFTDTKIQKQLLIGRWKMSRFLNLANVHRWYYDNDNFLKQEVALVKSLDPTRQIIISDSGEQF